MGGKNTDVDTYRSKIQYEEYLKRRCGAWKGNTQAK